MDGTFGEQEVEDGSELFCVNLHQLKAKRAAEIEKREGEGEEGAKAEELQ